MVVAPGQRLVDTVRVFALYPANGAGPEFKVNGIEGVYRLVLGGAVFHYNERDPSFGERVPVDRRTSNQFVLKVARWPRDGGWG